MKNPKSKSVSFAPNVIFHEQKNNKHKYNIKIKKIIHKLKRGQRYGILNKLINNILQEDVKKYEKDGEGNHLNRLKLFVWSCYRETSAEYLKYFLKVFNIRECKAFLNNYEFMLIEKAMIQKLPNDDPDKQLVIEDKLEIILSLEFEEISEHIFSRLDEIGINTIHSNKIHYYYNSYKQKMEEFEKRKEQLCRMLNRLACILRYSTTCVAVTINNSNFLISANEFFKTTKLNENQNITHIKNVMGDFSKLCELEGKKPTEEINQERMNLLRELIKKKLQKSNLKTTYVENILTRLKNFDQENPPNFFKEKDYIIYMKTYTITMEIYPKLKKIERAIKKKKFEEFNQAFVNFKSENLQIFICLEEEKQGVHCELQILSKIHHNLGKFHQNEYYIGCSYKFCIQCDTFFQTYRENHPLGKVFYYTDHHEGLFKNWVLPEHFKGEKIGKIFEKKLEAIKNQEKSNYSMEHMPSSSLSSSPDDNTNLNFENELESLEKETNGKIEEQEKLKLELGLNLTDYAILNSVKRLYFLTKELLDLNTKIAYHKIKSSDAETNSSGDIFSYTKFTINNKNVNVKIEDVVGDGNCAFHAAGINEPQEALNDLISWCEEKYQSDHEIVDLIFFSFKTTLSMKDFPLDLGTDEYGDDIEGEIKKLNSDDDLLTDYLKKKEVLIAYLQMIQKQKYGDFFLLQAIFLLQEKTEKLVLLYCTGDGQLRIMSCNEEFDQLKDDKNIILIVYKYDLSPWLSHYYRLKIMSETEANSNPSDPNSTYLGKSRPRDEAEAQDIVKGDGKKQKI